ncbi:MAG TPA: hypothetical protein DEB06_09610, partial [Phycisphaerales bacterium]|nr:hypothetical protein [Phycisphaerales bacterium]
MGSEPTYQDEFGLNPGTGQGPDAGQQNPMKWVHRSLRGRYHWAALLGLALAAPGAIIGYSAVPPLFVSSGFIEVAPRLEKTLYTTPDSEVPPMYDSYVSTQATYLSSARVLARAIDSPQMQALGWPGGQEGVSRLASALAVIRPRHQQVITVAVSHPDARSAQTAVNSVMDAYKEIYVDQSAMNVTERERQIDQRVQQLSRELSAIRESMLRIAQEYGTQELDDIHAQSVERLQRMENSIDEMRVQVGALEAAVPAPGAEAASPQPASDPTIDQLAESDAELKDLVERRKQIDKAIELNRTRYGPQHRQMQEFNRQRDALTRLIDDRVSGLLQLVAPGEDGQPAGPAAMRLARLRADLAALTILRDQTAAQVRDLGAKKVQIHQLQERESETLKRLNETATALDKIRTERPNLEQGRITVQQRGELPVKPSNDRRVALAGGGGVAGFGLGVGIIGLLGFLKRGYRYLDELDDLDRTASLLGTLPDLESPSEEDNQLAALAIHHIRNMLHVLSPSQQGRGRVFAVTSASAGEGKTSLSLALGMSFAVAGQRTLLVDADLIGRGLSAQLDMDTKRGISEAVAARGDIQAFVHKTSQENLWAIPAGADHAFNPERLSEAHIEVTIASLRDRFDTIVVDTGPILGSLEADIVCAMADRVVVAIKRGQAPNLVKASLSRLRHLGARSIGLVFNRATLQDMTKSISHVSIHSQSIRALPDGTGARRRKATPLA